MHHRVRTILLAWPLVAVVPAQAGWEEGVEAFKAKNYTQAAREFETVVRERGDWAGGYLMLGRSQLLLERPADAVATLRKAYDLEPSNLETQLALAQAYLATRRANEAAQLLAKVNPAGVPKERQGLYQQLQAKAAADSGNTDRAADALAKAAAASPNDASIQFNYGVLAFNAGDTNAAVTALERAVRLDPNDPDKQQVLVQALVRQGREAQGNAKDAIYAKAASTARNLVNRSASYENLLLFGETQLGAGQYDAAAATFAQASAKNGAEWLPHFYAGQANTAAGKYPQAESSLKSALARAASGADKARIQRQLGFVYEKQRDFDQAKVAYRTAGDEASVQRVEENEKIAAHNEQAEAEAKNLAELKRQQEELRKRLQEQGGTPPPYEP
jgi:tetratricopeptide (TPR) repeat protein